MLDITLLPAAHGDAIWIEYGSDDKRHHICIDGGPVATFAALERHVHARLPPRNRSVELLVITHIDSDHIEGVVRMLAVCQQDWLFHPDEIWFNGYHHTENTTLGARDGEYLSMLLREQLEDRWNTSFGGAVVLPRDGKPQPKKLKGGIELTLLSPDRRKLLELRDKWGKGLTQAGLTPGDDEGTLRGLSNDRRYRKAIRSNTLGDDENEIEAENVEALFRHVDPSAANGSSIAFLARYGDASCLFLADAHADLVAESIRGLLEPGETRLKVDAVKVSHHGSKSNISYDLLTLVDAEHYLFSTNGARHEHPDRETVAAILRYSLRDPVFWFNHRSPTTESFETMAADRPYQTRYPASEAGGITLRLPA